MRLLRRTARFAKGLGVVTKPHIDCEVQVITVRECEIWDGQK